MAPLTEKDWKTLLYVHYLAGKFKIPFKRLLSSIVKAWNTEKSSCMDLEIECRSETKDSAIFLLTSNSEVIAQFPLSTIVLMNEKRFARRLERLSDSERKVIGGR